MKFLSFVLTLVLPLCLLACADKPQEAGLVAAKTLGTVRGLHFARVITHFHTPYSFDACDGKGLSGTTPADWCVNDIKTALCTNRIDFVFTSDHTNYVSSTRY